jgi:hypothetical protein
MVVIGCAIELPQYTPYEAPGSNLDVPLLLSELILVAEKPGATPNARAEADLRGFTFHRQVPLDVGLTDRQRHTHP